MFDKFLNGLIFGAGAAVAVLVVAAPVYLIVNAPVFHGRVDHSRGRGEVSAAPDINDNGRFLGSSNTYDGDFSSREGTVLARGPGKITGATYVDGVPVVGLKLRLALNGSVMSQWVTTDAEGRYAIPVPYGRYRIDGFEFDRKTANSTLGGKIHHPQNSHSTGVFEVSEGAPGHGLDFAFVDPVILDMPKTRFAADEEVVVRWKPYPGATGYSVQVYEKSDPHSYGWDDTVFEWRERPTVEEPFMNITDYGAILKPGHFYVVEVEAREMGGKWPVISQTQQEYSGFDFEVTD